MQQTLYPGDKVTVATIDYDLPGRADFGDELDPTTPMAGTQVTEGGLLAEARLLGEAATVERLLNADELEQVTTEEWIPFYVVRFYWGGRLAFAQYELQPR
jgi:hypothetical protein